MTKLNDSCTLVLFGASGNLSRVKLLPGLFRLHSLGRLADDMKVLSVGRQHIAREDWHPPAADCAPTCVAIKQYLSTAGDHTLLV